MLHVSVGWWRGARRRFSRPLLLCALAILVTHCSLLVFCAVEDSPTDNEIGHLPAGLSHWRLGRFGLYAVNPPLVRLIATVPLAVGCVEIPYEGADFVPSHRGEWSVGMDFVRADPPRAVFWFAVARIACLPFAILGGCVCFLWARQLYGRIAGVVALTLWSFSPTVLAYGHLITPDLGAAATGVTAAYGFWRWLKMPTWEWTFVAGLLLGLAELTKTTWIVLFVFWPALWLVWRLTDLAARRGETIKLGAILVLAFLLINVGYGFEGSLQPLEDFKFVSQALTSRSVDGREGLPTEDNRFAGTCLGKCPCRCR